MVEVALSTPGCSSLTSWRVNGGSSCGPSTWWRFEVAVPVVRRCFLRGCSVSLVVTPGCSFPTSWRSRMLGARVMRLWSHVVPSVFRELLCLSGCVPRIASALCCSRPTLVAGRGVALVASTCAWTPLVLQESIVGCGPGEGCSQDCSGLLSTGCCATSGLRSCHVCRRWPTTLLEVVPGRGAVRACASWACRDSLSQEFVAGRSWWRFVVPCVASSAIH
ncbi:hypothetical protein Taro_045454 [Colocasia esculenta]|uniref:Uncharacterized protein n=1 Tax=Colocasia esculenta TaxID=4460 RepID=A0A843X491_COLES|nr:hypothetical protein [Colocasia esculenta]